MKVTVLCMDGDRVEGETESSSLTRLGFPLVPEGAASDEPAWIALGAIRQVELPGPPAPGAEDPREAANTPKVVVRFLDGQEVRTYRDEGFGQDGEGFRLLRWNRDSQRYGRLLMPLHTLKGIFNVKEWPQEAGPTPALVIVASPVRPSVIPPDTAEAAMLTPLLPRLRSAILDLPDSDLASRDVVVFEAALGRHLDALLARIGVNATEQLREGALRRLVDDAFGFGPLDPLLADASITEIMVNGPASVFIERDGRIEAAGVVFADDRQLINVIQRIVALAGRRIDHSSPMVDARLPDGSRVNAVLPPASPTGPSLTIRKFTRAAHSLAALVETGTLNTAMATFLDTAVRGRCNILVSGGTGTGKTTLLNVLAGRIPPTQRLITIEDTIELQIDHPNAVRLECRDTNVEGRGSISVRDLLRNSLRMRPDRIVVGEVRGPEAFDMLQAMITGHEGGLSTLHASTPRDAVLRFESLALAGSPGLTQDAIRAQILSAIDVIVHLVRMEDGSRRVGQIAELVGFDIGGPVMQPIFEMASHGNESVRFVTSRVVPRALETMRLHGVAVSAEMFSDGHRNPLMLVATG